VKCSVAPLRKTPTVAGPPGLPVVTLAMVAVFARSVGQIGHGVPLHGADKAEVAGGDHVEKGIEASGGAGTVKDTDGAGTGQTGTVRFSLFDYFGPMSLRR